MFKMLSAGLLNVICKKTVAIVLTVFMLSACEKPDTVLVELDADLVFRNAKIYTVDTKQPWASAIAVRDGKIMAVGGESDVENWSGDATKVVDLGGKLLLPGFGDTHVHPMFGGLSYSRCSMHAGQSIQDYKKVIKKCVQETEAGSWVYGVGWKPGLFPPDGIPEKAILDSIESERPLVFRSTGGHSLWVNSKALELAGITRDTPDPVNGRIDRDPETGELLGGLQEAAKDIVSPYLPEPTFKQLQGALMYTSEHLNSLGITNFLDAGVSIEPDGSSAVIEAYKVVRSNGDLQAHVALAVTWDNEAGMEQLPVLLSAARNVSGSGLFSRTVKIYLDGVLAQRTAAMLEPYSDAKDELGEATLSPEVLNEIVRRFDAEGFQVMIHAIGDKAIRMALDAFEQARKDNGKTDNRHQITHAELITPQDALRFAELDVFASFQPLWSVMDEYMQMSAIRIGPERMQYVYPANSIIKAGARIVYGADWPVASANPLQGIEVALTRRAPGDPDAEPLLTSEAVSLVQALEAYTLAVAYVNHREDITGSLTVGKSADLIVLDQDLFTISVYEISKTKVLLTLFAGQAIYGSIADL